MPSTERLAVGAGGLVVCALLASGCAGSPVEADSTGSGPAVVETVEGSDVSRLTLTDDAVERLDLTTTPVVEEVVPPRTGATAAPGERKIVPYGALIYDNAGATWVYVTEEPLVYVREPITVDYIEGDRIVLVDGPAAGTDVVTVGAAELYGAELGLGQ